MSNYCQPCLHPGRRRAVGPILVLGIGMVSTESGLANENQRFFVGAICPVAGSLLIGFALIQLLSLLTCQLETNYVAGLEFTVHYQNKA